MNTHLKPKWLAEHSSTTPPEMDIGRELHVQGAHVAGHNQGNFGSCLVGGCDSEMQAQDNFTLAQRKALFALISQLQE